nr:hypothetical protein CPGR_05168 [Mycolicibacterium malmesburyense]
MSGRHNHFGKPRPSRIFHSIGLTLVAETLTSTSSGCRKRDIGSSVIANLLLSPKSVRTAARRSPSEVVMAIVAPRTQRTNAEPRSRSRNVSDLFFNAKMYTSSEIAMHTVT